MTRRSFRFQGVRDLRFFISWDGLPVLLGTIGLALLELNALPLTWPLAWFINDHKLAVVVGLVLLIVLPPPIARGLGHLRDREAAVFRNVEAATAYRGLGSRAANFIGKMREAFEGEITNQYQNHLLVECQKYFESRPMPDGANRPNDFRVEACFYAMKINAQGRLLERKLFTNTDHSRMRSTFSNRLPGEGRYAVERIGAGEYIFCADVKNPIYADPLSIKNGGSRPYRTFLSVPVFRDRRSEGDQRVIGMLSVNVTHLGVLHESDRHILEVYAWFLSAAIEADRLAEAAATR